MRMLCLLVCASCGGKGSPDRIDAPGTTGDSAPDARIIPAGQIYESFDVDPGWDGHNNRVNAPRTIVQSFGYSSTSNAGGNTGEVGGQITPCGETAYYAKSIAPLTLNQAFSASGKVKVSGGGNTLLGFFNDGTVNEWRTANSIVVRLYGRGTYFNAYAEYGTARWRAGAGYFPGDVQFPINTAYNWTLSYDPVGNGTVTLTLQATGGGTLYTATTTLGAGHKADGATFTRFGLLDVAKSADDPGSVWIDNVNINGSVESFDTDPGWTAVNNVATYSSNNIRFNFDFGYSATSFAGGAAAGEMGGYYFRGDSREAAKLAFYGDPLGSTFSFDTPLHADGVVSFRRGVTDSTVHIGFFHDTESVRVSSNQAQSTPENFIGATIEGPSSEGFYFYPSYGSNADGGGSGGNTGTMQPPHIYPDAAIHHWTLDYDPQGNAGTGQIVVSLDGQQGVMNVDPTHRAAGATFNRFGCITPHTDGNGQTVYFDDLVYSYTQP